MLSRAHLVSPNALDRRADDARIDDLPAPGSEARLLQLAAQRRADVTDQFVLPEPLTPYTQIVLASGILPLCSSDKKC